MLHVYDPTTGDIVAISNGSKAQVKKWRAAGYMVVEGPRIDRTRHKYVHGILTTKPAPVVVPEKDPTKLKLSRAGFSRAQINALLELVG